jgi:transposase
MSHESVSNKPLIRHVNRQQMSWRAVDVEQLISEDHPARAIWALVGRLDLRRFYENIESSAEEGGRPAIDPQLLISLWVYAYSRGIGSAREIERRCEYDPAFQWLTGIEPVNYHTLADFRVEQGKELHQLFSDLLGVLSAEGLITLEEVMQDGTKIKAQASGKTFRREKTLREHVERARLQVEALRDPLAEPAVNRRQQAARERASREKRERLEQALVELEKLREPKKTAEEKRETRTSTSDPEARVMKQAGGGFAPSYNAQISTDGKHGLRFAATQFVYEAEQDRYICPAGKPLLYEGRDERGGLSYLKYKAAAEDCKNCSLRAACCSGNQKHSRSIVRSKESPVMNAFREKMATEQAQAVYRRRGPIAEFVHAWIKSKLGLRQFHVRGLNKVRAEMLWVCFTFNVQQWIRLGRAPAMALAN